MIEKIIKMLETEKACVERQDRKPKCNRYCEACDLCMPIEEVIDGYNKAIEAIKENEKLKQELKAVKQELATFKYFRWQYEDRT